MPAYTSSTQYAWGRPWTPGVRALILITTVVFLAQLVLARTPWPSLLAIQVPDMLRDGKWWQPFTYLFLHGGFWHLAFNLLTLWMFGTEVELALGTPRFLAYYLFTGVGAGWCVAGLGTWAGEHSLTIGASGAIFGVLAAYGILFAERTLTLLLFFILPVQMKAKTMVWFFAAFEFVAGVGNALGQVSHIAHLSGLAFGYLFFLLGWARPGLKINPIEQLRHWWLGRRVRKIHVREDDPDQAVDQVLEKISKHGINALNNREREILAEASRRRGRWPESN